ncbi:OsmC family protein [Bradyrhizobium diazoefficiens]|uniref:OsmC family protein n=1 Tax=Bradyrhizobium diazoefficiens TaxID=1355477 RepID=UPI003908B545
MTLKKISTERQTVVCGGASCQKQSIGSSRSAKSRRPLIHQGRSRRGIRRATVLKHVLTDLCLCHEMTYRLNAEKLGISLKSVSVRVIEENRLTSLLNLRQDERRSTQPVQVEVTLDSAASESGLAKLKDIVDRSCPGFQVLCNLAPVQSSLCFPSWTMAAE